MFFLMAHSTSLSVSLFVIKILNNILKYISYLVQQKKVNSTEYVQKKLKIATSLLFFHFSDFIGMKHYIDEVYCIKLSEPMFLI